MAYLRRFNVELAYTLTFSTTELLVIQEALKTHPLGEVLRQEIQSVIDGEQEDVE
jgi:hypothetical protein